MEHPLEQNLDLFSDEQLGRLFRVPHWQNIIQRAQPSLSSETLTRIDVLQPRSAVGKLLHVVRNKLRSWSLPEGITLAEADGVIRQYKEKLSAAKDLMHKDGFIALMNEVVAERFSKYG